MAFMGGLDLCFGRWDTNSHPIADAHPTNVDNILFPGQDFNNARVYDFMNVTKFMDNKLDRTKNSRMGWSDLSLCLTGQVVEDLKAHFVQRWNFIYNEKYDVRKDARYHPLVLNTHLIPENYYHENGKNVKLLRRDSEDDEDPEGPNEERQERAGWHVPGGDGSMFDHVKSKFHDVSRAARNFGGNNSIPQALGGMSVQLVRSCTRWSHGVSTEVCRVSNYPNSY